MDLTGDFWFVCQFLKFINYLLLQFLLKAFAFSQYLRFYCEFFFRYSSKQRLVAFFNLQQRFFICVLRFKCALKELKFKQKLDQITTFWYQIVERFESHFLHLGQSFRNNKSIVHGCWVAEVFHEQDLLVEVVDQFPDKGSDIFGGTGLGGHEDQVHGCFMGFSKCAAQVSCLTS